MKLFAILTLITSGCGVVEHTCKDSYDYTLRPIAPFEAEAKCDGQVIMKAAGPERARFYVDCPADRVPGYLDDGEVTCVRR